MNREQHYTLEEHFKHLVGLPNTPFGYDDDGNITDSSTNEPMKTPEGSRYKYNVREAWHDFLTAMGPWYARGLYGRIHQLPHAGLFGPGRRRRDTGKNLYDANPQRYSRVHDYSAPNQWHTRADFELGVPGQEHLNNWGHDRRPYVDAHNNNKDNHWFGSHIYWGPYDFPWFEEGHQDGTVSGKITVNNAEEGYHPDVYERFGGEKAQALPFLHGEVIHQHNLEDSSQRIHGPDPLHWDDHVWEKWNQRRLGQPYHSPKDYGQKYWDEGEGEIGYPPEFTPPPSNPQGLWRIPNSPKEFDPDEWENRMKD